MAATTRKPLELSHDKAVAGMLALQIEDRETRIDEKHKLRKTEVVLAEAGLTSGEIAALMGKQMSAVSMTVSRAKNAKKRGKRGRK